MHQALINKLWEAIEGAPAKSLLQFSDDDLRRLLLSQVSAAMELDECEQRQLEQWLTEQLPSIRNFAWARGGFYRGAQKGRLAIALELAGVKSAFYRSRPPTVR